ncbi:MAG: TIGR03936 family radical SAM-associated protein [Planctomycetota bacterium]
MVQESNPGELQNGARCRCAFGFSIEGDLRFISHHDTLRMFRRALARAQLPVRFSEGFNPQPKIVIPLPRPVGVSSSDEMVVVDFDELLDIHDAHRRLGEHLPRGIHLLEARQLDLREKLHPDTVDYRFDPDGPVPVDFTSRVQSLLSSAALPVERHSPKYQVPRTIDVRPYLLDLRAEESFIVFRLRITGDGTAKPSEIIGLLGFDATHVNHRIHRLKVHWH